MTATDSFQRDDVVMTTDAHRDGPNQRATVMAVEPTRVLVYLHDMQYMAWRWPSELASNR